MEGKAGIAPFWKWVLWTVGGIVALFILWILIAFVAQEFISPS